MTIGWTQSERRVQVHEIGHGVVDYLLSRIATDRTVYWDNGEWVGHAEPVSGGKPFRNMSRDEQLAAVAGFLGGWAAVNLAIARGMLPEEPDGIEDMPGDRGYLGGETSDRHWVEHFSRCADPSNPDGFAQAARRLAIDTLESRMEIVIKLAEGMSGIGVLPAETLVDALDGIDDRGQENEAV